MRKRDLLKAAIAAPFCLCGTAVAERNIVTNPQTRPGVTPAAAFSPNDQDVLTAIAKNGMTKERQPGLVVGIWAPGRGNWRASFGRGDIAANVPMRGSDHVRIASITKTFVATAILQLVDLGKLRLDDKLSTYIEGLPNADIITIRNLLGMTSGIYDFTMDDEFGKDFVTNPMMPFSPDNVIGIVKRHAPDFAPGEKVSYCDTNYILLGMILEKVARKPVAQIIEEQVLVPLRLRSTSFPTNSAIPAPFAHGYYAGANGKGPFRDYTNTNPNVAWTAGAMISTRDDLRIWARALATGTLLKPETHKEQTQFGLISESGGLSVAYGLGIARIGKFVGHNGAILGYTTAMFYLPGADATFVLAGNQASNFSNATTDIFYPLAKHLFAQGFGSPT